jgi:hypothetical protein
MREHVIAEANRRRGAGEPATAPALFKWAQKNFGKNVRLKTRTISQWISTKRQK